MRQRPVRRPPDRYCRELAAVIALSESRYRGHTVPEFVELARVEEGNGTDYLRALHAKIPRVGIAVRLPVFRRGGGIEQNDHHATIAEALRERFLVHRRAAVKTIGQRGVARGDFRADVDADVAMDMIFAPIVYRLLAGHAPLVESLADALVDAALRGLAGQCSGVSKERESQ